MPADLHPRLRVRVFVDFWNYTLSMRDNVDPTFKTDWAKLGPELAREAVAKVDATATGEYQGLNFYGSYDRTTEKGLHRWATTVVDTTRGLKVIHGAFPPSGAHLTQRCWGSIDIPRMREDFRR